MQLRLLLVLFFCINGGIGLFAYDGSATISSSGKTRSFIFHASGTTVAANLPVLFVFHGDGGSGAGVRNSTLFNATADANGFLVVYPNADNDGNGWHRAIDQTKDAVFTSDMIDYLCSTYHIDASRVYATGHSAGGFMTYNLAVNLPGKIAAFAPVAGNMYASNGNTSYFSSPDFKPVPILHIHGDPDNTVAYPDPNHEPTPWGEWPLTQWSYYACGKTTYTLPNENITTGVTKLKFCTGTPPAGKEISMIRVTGVGHGWPRTNSFDPNQAIWDFVKNYRIENAASCAPVPEVPTHMAGTIHTQGRNILSPCDEVFIPRGVNYSLADDWEFPANINGDPTHVNDELSAEIIKANPNTVRIQWYVNRQSGWKPYSVADLDVVVSRFRNAGIVSIIELHDVTCSNSYTTFNSVITPWWKQQSVLNLLSRHKGFVIANIANEFGTVRWAGNPAAAFTTWTEHYKNVITELRNAGVEVPLMIDAPDCGQSLDYILQAGAPFKQHDPLHNIIMSAHSYWYADNAAAMETRAQQIANAPFPIVLGEVANIQDANGPCSNTITAYADLLQSCQNHQIGWLAWTWTDDWCDGPNGRRISLNGNYTNLSTYGNVIINNPNFGLATHAVKMICAEPPLPVTLVFMQVSDMEPGALQITWRTASEEKFSRFEVERSMNGKTFTKISEVVSKGATDYHYADRQLSPGRYYYRLKMIDKDGSYAYSSIRSGILSDLETLVFPSPARDFLTIRKKTGFNPGELRLLDPFGKTAVSVYLKSSDQKIHVAHLAEGLYIVTMNDKVIGKVIISGK